MEKSFLNINGNIINLNFVTQILPSIKMEEETLPSILVFYTNGTKENISLPNQNLSIQESLEYSRKFLKELFFKLDIYCQ